ncbi:twitching motility protein PilT [Candidatus Bipolaricaulota bacterium]|nr:twitching motility protein PilT [Candidatus Bipolaricaulota bacterium]
MSEGLVKPARWEIASCACQRGSGGRRAWLRFYGELNDHLPAEARQRAAVMRFDVAPTVKCAIEGFGVPHVEVSLVTRAGEPLGFSDRIAAEDRIAVYPLFTRLDVSASGSVGIAPPRPTRFIADTHLHRLCRLLRLLGIDTEIIVRGEDPVTASISSRRVVLTRDRHLLMRRSLELGYWVRSMDPMSQVAEVVQRFDLAAQVRPLQRCSVCNGLLASVDKQDVARRLPPRTAAWLDTYTRCEHCGKLYWRGTHVDRIAATLEKLVAGPPVGGR